MIEDGKLILEINDRYNKAIKMSRKLLKICDENNLKLVLKNNGKNITKKDNKELYNIVKAINIKNINDRYNFIYDTVCDYIDEKYIKNNYCDFIDNVCVFFRNNSKIAHEDGCCFSAARGGECINLKNHKCTIKSISCKLYSCEYLRNKKINFKIKDIPLLKYFFNLKQKYILKYSFFKPKSYVMYKLMEVKNK